MEASTVKGTTLLLLDLPPQALAGINLLSFTTTPRFKGIKHLPAGLHFIFASSSTALSIRHGAWIRVSSTEDLQLFVKRWDASKEELITVEDKAEVLKWKANLGSIWREGLTPYRQSAGEGSGEEETQDWSELTSQTSDAVLSRILGSTWTLTSASSAMRDVDDIPGLDTKRFDADQVLKVLPIELKQTWRPGATGRERTEAARDHSWALGELIDEHCDGEEMQVLGELQLCFLMILTLNNYSCLEQWKRILRLLFTCQVAVVEKTQLFVETLRILRLQLKRSQDAEGGLFDLSEDGAGFLKLLLRRFKKSLDEIDGKAKLDVMDELDELGSFLSSNYGWSLEDNQLRTGFVTLDDGERVEMTMNGYDEEDESGEYAPTVVDLTEEQLKVLSGSKKKQTDSESTDNEEEDQEESEDDADLEDMDARY
jgi:A1 cistron-splicing factor AAR2